MPQMSPMNWTLLYLFFTSIFVLGGQNLTLMKNV